MKTIATITEDRFGAICFWFHKYFRVCDAKGTAAVWNAINALPDEPDNVYSDAMEAALAEAGIKVKHPKKKE